MFFNKNDLSVGMIFFVSGICIYLEALKIKKISLASKMIVQDITGPAGFTAIVSVLMVIVGLVYLTGALFCRKQNNTTKNGQYVFCGLKENLKNNRKTYMLVLISLLYIIAIPYLGYIVTTIIYMLLLLNQFKYKEKFSSVLISSGFAFFMFIIFSKLLKVSLPTIFNNFWI